MPDRKIAPELSQSETIQFVTPKVIQISDTCQLNWMKNVPDETVRIEFHFDAGSIQGEKNRASFVNALLLSGTAQKTSQQIHEEFDQLGAYIDHEIAMEKAFISVFCLRKNASSVVALLHETLSGLIFPEHEVEDMLQEKKQRFLVSCEKVSFLARKEFQAHLFDKNPNYSRQMELKDFASVSQESLRDFYQKYYLKGLRKMVVVSNLEQDFIDQLIHLFSPWTSNNEPVYESKLENKNGHIHVEKKGAVQTAIRIGIPLFNKKHAHFIDFQLMQTILGDYFGSRLMSNIREDKGYTYGIGCALVELQESGYFIIATEVGKEVTNETLTEIQYEINRLKQELVSAEELDLVKNYISGQMLKSADGPNATMDLFLGADQHGLDLEYYNEYLKKIKEITAEELQKVAMNYLDWEKFTVITVGERN